MSDLASDPTVAQAAKEAKVSKLMIRNLIKAGKLKSYKISERNTRIIRSSLEALREGGC